MRKIAVFCMLGLVLPASAIVVQDYTLAEAAPAGLDWNYVYNYKGSSAVSVGGGWLLTAKHVADDGGDGTVTNGPGYQQQAIIYHPDADLALVRFDKAFPGSYALYTGDIPAITNQVLMVGYGTTGTVNNDYWTNDDSGGGTKRWGSQIIDRTSIKRYDFTVNYGFLMEFDLTNTTHEAGGGAGDSGGGIFYNGKLVGINTSLSSALVGEETRYSGTFAARMPYYADWVMATTNIPEPAAIGLMGFATVGLFLSRAKRRRKLAGRSVFPIRGDESICDRFDAVEGSENPEKRGYTDYLAGMLEMMRTSPLAVWMNTLHTRYNTLNKAIWRFITAAVEQSSVRKEAAEERVNKVAVKSLDVFLDKISWDRIVISVRSGRTIVARSLRMSVLKSLDVFLAKISWDQLTAAYMRCKKAIRFSSRR